jgi:hypothetical protein
MLRLTPFLHPKRLALCVLGALLVVGCAPAPSVTFPKTAQESPSRPLSVQGVLKAEIKRVGLEPSPYHEVTAASYIDPFLVVPLSERASLFVNENYLYGLIVDPANADRFTFADSPDAPGVTHLGCYPDWQTNLTPMLVAERGGVVATRIGYGSDEGQTRLAFPQATEGPITIRANAPNMAIYTEEDGEDVVYRQVTVPAEAIAPLDDAQDVVIEFNVTNLDGEPINGLDKEYVRVLYDNLGDDGEPEYGLWPLPYEKLEAIAEGQYRIREAFSPYRKSGAMRFSIELGNAGAPIQATFYRR